MKRLDYREWEELKVQLSRTYSESKKAAMQAEHIKLIYLLNRLGYQPLSEEEAIILAEELLQIGWE